MPYSHNVCYLTQLWERFREGGRLNFGRITLEKADQGRKGWMEKSNLGSKEVGEGCCPT